MMRWMSLFLLLVLPGCLVLPSRVDRELDFVVAVKSARLPAYMPWYSRFAEHSWVDIKDAKGWHRVEVIGRRSGVKVARIKSHQVRENYRFGGRDVRIHALYTGAEAQRIGAAVLECAKDFPHADRYRPFPGPNSNTFVEWLGQQVPGFRFVQPPAALGKDYPVNGWISAGPTTSRLGLELETPYLGVQLGLQEGAELHLLGLTMGLGLYPPSIKLPLLPAFPWEWF